MFFFLFGRGHLIFQVSTSNNNNLAESKKEDFYLDHTKEAPENENDGRTGRQWHTRNRSDLGKKWKGKNGN